MARLRDPQHGCAWDLQQTYASIAPYTIEEAYEVADAIAGGDLDALRDELGDLLLQVVFHAQMASEQGAFGFDDVARSIADKLVRRHPHVFGDVRYRDQAEQSAAWERIKAEERAAGRAGEDRPARTLDGVAAGLPALTRAIKLQRKAALVGFDWPDPEPVLDKIAEELAELRAALREEAPGRAGGTGRTDPVEEAKAAPAAAGPPPAVVDELGDLMFAVANLARHLGVDPDQALRRTNRKFETRFAFIEDALAGERRRPEDAGLAEMETLWQLAKTRAKTDP